MLPEMLLVCFYMHQERFSKKQSGAMGERLRKTMRENTGSVSIWPLYCHLWQSIRFMLFFYWTRVWSTWRSKKRIAHTTKRPHGVVVAHEPPKLVVGVRFTLRSIIFAQVTHSFIVTLSVNSHTHSLFRSFLFDFVIIILFADLGFPWLFTVQWPVFFDAMFESMKV